MHPGGRLRRMETDTIAFRTPEAGVAAALAASLRDRSARVGVIGLGYVGLPVALGAARAGFPVSASTSTPRKVDAAQPRREPHQPHRRRARIADGDRGQALFEATADFDRLGEPDAILICVPTPLTRHREPDLSYVDRHGAGHRAAPAPGPARRAGIDHLSGHDRRGAQADPRAQRPASGARLLPRLLARARGPRQRAFRHRATIPKVVGGDGPDARDARRRALRARSWLDIVPVSSTGDGRGGEAHREHLPRRQHRPRQRAEGRLRRHGHRHLGGDRGGQDQALRLHAVLSRARPRRPLHPDRPVLPDLEGARVRRRRPASSSSPARSTRAMPHYVVDRLAEALDRRARRGLKGARDPDHRASPTRRTSTTCARARR